MILVNWTIMNSVWDTRITNVQISIKPAFIDPARVELFQNTQDPHLSKND